jgi:hypothetical protein
LVVEWSAIKIDGTWFMYRLQEWTANLCRILFTSYLEMHLISDWMTVYFLHCMWIFLKYTVIQIIVQNIDLPVQVWSKIGSRDNLSSKHRGSWLERNRMFEELKYVCHCWHKVYLIFSNLGYIRAFFVLDLPIIWF